VTANRTLSPRTTVRADPSATVTADHRGREMSVSASFPQMPVPSDPKILLWDIDGTLVRTPGVGVKAFARALETVTGLPMARVAYDFGGKTDPLIARDLLAAVGVVDSQDANQDSAVSRLLAEVERNYDEFADDLRSTIVTLPGAAVLLERCAEFSAVQSVVTGNIRYVARRKLEAARMDHRLDLDRGGYGSDHHDRTELVRIALARLGARDDVGEIDPSRVWIIGDTPRDAACARGAGVRCLLVATGTYAVDDLSGLGAEHVLADLADVERVLDILSA
jgi:phosphoglycolate phosphatase